MDWSDFYLEQAGRGVRPTFTAALQAWQESHGAAVGDAIDLGCGDGVETRALLADGWRVLAIDADPHVVDRVTSGVPATDVTRLTVRRASFDELARGDARAGLPSAGPTDATLPAADLVYAGFALPFCSASVFARLWSGIRSALRPGGMFAGELFGPHDDFAAWADVNTHDRTDVERLLDGLQIVRLQEDERDGASFRGPKHWHVFHIIAREAT